MKSYFIDEIEASDMVQIERYLAKHGNAAGISKLFWIEMPEANLNSLQTGYESCCPHRFAVETGDSWVRAEFFVRTSKNLMCAYSGYCDEKQREYIINYIDKMIRELRVRT
jgi:hypothetical protein